MRLGRHASLRLGLIRWPDCRPEFRTGGAKGARGQLLQLVGLSRPGGARRIHQRDRHQGPLRHFRFQRHAGGEAPSRRSGYDVVVPSAYFLARQITAGIFQKSTSPSCRTCAERLAGDRQTARLLRSRQPVCRRLHVGNDRYRLQREKGEGNPRARRRRSIPGNTCSSRTRSRSSRIAAFIFSIHPTTSCRRRCTISISIRIQRSGRSQKATDLLVKIRPYVRKFHSSEYLNALATGRNLLRGRFFRRRQTGEKARGGCQGRHRDWLFDPQGRRAIMVRQSRHSEGRAGCRKRRTN